MAEILIKNKDGEDLYPKTKAELVEGLKTVAITGSYKDLTDKPAASGITYEDLNEGVTINPTPIEEEWESFRNSINATISGYEAQVASLQSQLNTTTSELNNTKTELSTTKSELSTTKSSLNTVTTELNTVKKVRYVTEKYSSGTNWYTIYSDKWCEMGGVTSAWFRGTTNVITFFKTFKSKPTFICNLEVTNGEANEMRVVIGNTSNNSGVNFVTTSQATVYIHGISGSGTDGGPVHWEAKGYIS